MQCATIHTVLGGHIDGTGDGSNLLFHNETHHKTHPTIIVQLNVCCSRHHTQHTTHKKENRKKEMRVRRIEVPKTEANYKLVSHRSC